MLGIPPQLLLVLRHCDGCVPCSSQGHHGDGLVRTELNSTNLSVQTRQSRVCCIGGPCYWINENISEVLPPCCAAVCCWVTLQGMVCSAAQQEAKEALNTRAPARGVVGPPANFPIPSLYGSPFTTLGNHTELRQPAACGAKRAPLQLHHMAGRAGRRQCLGGGCAEAVHLVVVFGGGEVLVRVCVEWRGGGR
jgi:hypothetical protein